MYLIEQLFHVLFWCSFIYYFMQLLVGFSFWCGASFIRFCKMNCYRVKSGELATRRIYGAYNLNMQFKYIFFNWQLFKINSFAQLIVFNWATFPRFILVQLYILFYATSCWFFFGCGASFIRFCKMNCCRVKSGELATHRIYGAYNLNGQVHILFKYGSFFK